MNAKDILRLRQNEKEKKQMADNQSYLIKRGWKQDEASRRIWIDPLDNSCWSMSAAVSFQQSRDAIHLDTALATLELADTGLDLMLSLFPEPPDDDGSGKIGFSDNVRTAYYKAQAALAAVRAARLQS